MPQQTQIFVGDNRDGNSDYEIPGNAEIRVLAVNATFADNGAGADWCPAVVMLSDSGSVIARALLPDVKVTAGDDAEASFFPGVKPGAAAVTPTGTLLAFAQGNSEQSGGDGVQAVAAGAAAYGSHAHVTTTAPSIMSWFTQTNTNDALSLAANGTYLVWAQSLWNTSSVHLTTTIMNSAVSGFRHDPFLPTAFASNVPTDGLANSQDYDVFHVTSGGAYVKALHQNGESFNSSVNAQYLTAVYLGTG